MFINVLVNFVLVDCGKKIGSVICDNNPLITLANYWEEQIVSRGGGTSRVITAVGRNDGHSI